MTEDEKRFWDAAFCAAITGGMAIAAHPQSPGFCEGAAEQFVSNAMEVADAALTARRARMEK